MKVKKDFITDCTEILEIIETVTNDVEDQMTFPMFYIGEKIPDNADRPRIVENLTLAFNHLEDAAERIRKAIKDYEGK